MLKIFTTEFSRYTQMINVKSVLNSQHIDTTLIFSAIMACMQFMGLSASIFLSIGVLFSMMVLDLMVKRTVIGRKFGGINKAKKLGFWKSHITREKMAKKTANYSFIMFAVFLMTFPLSFYDIGIGPINTKSLQELLRIIAHCILIGIEFDSVMENIKSQFDEDEKEKIEAIYKKVKAGTTDIMEMRLDNILGSIRKNDISEKVENEETKTNDLDENHSDQDIKLEE